MQVKVFEADDMAAALKKVKAALGPDAIILSTRTVRGKGLGLGLLGKPQVQVTAAIDPPHPAGSSRAAAAASAYAQTAAPRPAMAVEEERPDFDGELRRLRAQITDTTVSASSEVGALRAELDQLKDLVRGLAQPAPAAAPPAPAAPAPVRTAPAPASDAANDLDLYGIDADVAQTLRGYLQGRLSRQEEADPARRLDRLQDTVTDLLQIGTPVTAAAEGQRRLALVGPTGVGKTTTIAKLAAAAMVAGQRVALVTVDTYRIAAAEQLQVYGEIMGLPVDVVLSPEELQQALARHRDKDLILIDTAGRSPRDTARIDEMVDFFGPDSGIETCLVLSATTRDRDLTMAVRRFGRLELQGLIFTKIDECDTLGVLLNVAVRTSLPLLYLTNGQRVPEDLLAADAREVAQMIFTRHEEVA